MTAVLSSECPTTLEAFVQLMAEQGDRYIPWEALNEGARHYLRDHCILAGSLLRLGDLIVFVGHYHKHWYDMLDVVTQVLQRCHVLPCGYRPSDFFWEPETDVPDEYFRLP